MPTSPQMGRLHCVEADKGSLTLTINLTIGTFSSIAICSAILVVSDVAFCINLRQFLMVFKSDLISSASLSTKYCSRLHLIFVEKTSASPPGHSYKLVRISSIILVYRQDNFQASIYDPVVNIFGCSRIIPTTLFWFLF